jgi:DNA-binding transcriptional LysR family regulator
MDSDQIRSFIAVAEQGSFTRAAQKMYISPQAMQQQMNAFESQVGTRLFVRSPRGVVLTSAGSFLYNRFRMLARYVDETLESCRSIGERDLSPLLVGITSDPILLPTVCSAFERSNFSAGVRKVEVDQRDCLELLRNGAIDLYETGIPMPAEKCSELGVRNEKVCELRAACIMAPGNPLEEKETVSIPDLEGFRLGTREGILFPSLRAAFEARRLPVPEVDARVLGCEEATMFCLEGGVFISHVSTAGVFTPLPYRAIENEFLGVWFITREQPGATVARFVETARLAFSGESVTKEK